MTTISNDDNSGRVLPEHPVQYKILSDIFTEMEEIPSAGYNRLVSAQRYGKRFMLKGLKPDFDNELYRSLLRKEFEIMVQMNHPYVVRVHSLEEVEGVGLCIVMDYVDGQPLDRWLATKPSKALRQRVVGQLLDAMDYWHSLQIVHRDLKPGNILVTRNGNNLRVIDFGLADADQYTAFKEPAYTLSYASPEQISKNGEPIDCRSDIYSFGRLLHLIYPHGHRLVVARCCRHNRQQRYASAVAVRRALRRGPILSAALLSLLLATTVIIVFNTIHHNSAPFPYVVGEGQVTQQQKPRMLVIPSDQMLERFGKLHPEDAQGKTVYNRDFGGYLLTDKNSKFIIASIQEAFIDFGYPLNDLELTLKSINDQEMVDEADGIRKDAKTMLLTTAKPDIILELDYSLANNEKSRNLEKKLTYTLRAIDAFSNKVVATIQQADFKKGSETNPSVLMKAALEQDSKKYTSQINDYFNSVITNGRDITMRITINGDVNLSMSDECLNGDSYTDFIIDWMKENTLKGAYIMDRNTDTELYFTDVRIKALNDNGTQYSAYDFARDLSKALNKGCGVKSQNSTQGLGDALISIKGM